MQTDRLFYSLWPDEAERAALAAAAHRLFPLAGLAVPAADLHVTLAFVGAVDAARTARFLELNRALPTVALRFDAVEHWPKSRVLVATARVVPEGLLRGVDELWQRLDRLGVARDSRPFRPHVTLARDVRRWRGATNWLPVTWTAREIRLVRSDPDASPRYEPLPRPAS
jgi:RNA 2',3'-cyclic 3'-phosphodiesterase